MGGFATEIKPVDALGWVGTMASETTRHCTIVLAGGRSSRTGEVLGPKGLIEVGGLPFLVWQVQSLRALDLTPIVVTGHHHAAYAEVLAGQAARIVRNPAPERGPFSSLQCGLEVSCAREPMGVFIQPLDVPVPSGAVFAALRSAGGSTAAAIPTHEGRGGHPVWLPPRIAAALRTVPEGPDARLDRQLASWAERGAVVRIPVEDPRVRVDLNTEGAWRAYLDLHRQP